MSTDIRSNSDRYIRTDEVSTKLRTMVYSALAREQNTLIQAPTSIGKSHLVSSTAWSGLPEVTGGEPLIHISPTKAARDEAATTSKKEGINYVVLRGRKDVCPVAAGEYDDGLPEIDGLVASEWLDRKCDAGKVPFSQAHAHLEKKLGWLPCYQSESCAGVTQWDELEQKSEVDVIHVTANFAHVSHLIDGANVIYDERPDYRSSIDQEVVRRVATRVLNEQEGGYRWEGLLEAVQREDQDELSCYQEIVNSASYKWNVDDEHVQTLALQITRAIVNSRRVKGGSLHAGWSGRVGIIIDEKNTLKSVYHRPNLAGARCVIGLDAHPSPLRWELDTGIDFRYEQTISKVQEREWRQNQRGLEIIQVGDKARSYTTGWRGTNAKEQVRALIQGIADKHGEAFRSCICAKAIEDDVVGLMKDAGIQDPKTAHYGAIKSSNKFADEPVGLVIGCIDPGDHNVAYMMGLLGLTAEPERYETNEGELKRAYGRGFVGPDAEEAIELLESVRAQGVAQAAGRFARDSRNPEGCATVYVASSVLPNDLVDAQVPGLVSREGEKKDRIEEFVRTSETPVTGPMVEEAIGCSRKHALEVLKLMEEQGLVIADRESVTHQFEYLGGYLSPVVDLEGQTAD